MKQLPYDIVYFLGIGGIGMSALARYFHSQGVHVLGYDRTSTALTTELQLEGIAVHFDDSTLEIPQLVRHADKSKVLVVYTPAIPGDSYELNWFIENGYHMQKRSQVLGLITESSDTIAVAGTHGKTTTSSMVAHILQYSGMGCNAFLGGIATNYNSNLLINPDARWTVVEADEFDRSFLTLSPWLSIITSMDADHLDIYGTHSYMLESFNLFAQKIRNGGRIVYKSGLPLEREKLDYAGGISTYCLNDSSDYRAKDIRVEDGSYKFTFQSPDLKIENLTLGLAGRHNIENATAACAVALMAGVSPDVIPGALASFKGVKRRFEYVVKTEKLVIIDDYAHHPEELKACINSARELYPDKKITGVFQPHLFSRTRDFADEFARSLELLDQVILLPIYPAREKPMEGIHSQMLLDKIFGITKSLVEKSELLAELRRSEHEVVIMLGAGDIDAMVSTVAYGLTNE